MDGQLRLHLHYSGDGHDSVILIVGRCLFSFQRVVVVSSGALKAFRLRVGARELFLRLASFLPPLQLFQTHMQSQ
jgi:hypothetical protein